MSQEELNGIESQHHFWSIFNKKKRNMLALLQKEGIFESHVRYVLQKMAKQGYQRVEFRVEPLCVGNGGLKEYFKLIEKAVKEVR